MSARNSPHLLVGLTRMQPAADGLSGWSNQSAWSGGVRFFRSCRLRRWGNVRFLDVKTPTGRKNQPTYAESSRLSDLEKCDDFLCVV